MPIISKGKVSKVEYLFGEPADDLVSGTEGGQGIYTVIIKTPGDYSRGELLMLSGDGREYVKATRDGIGSSKSLVILSEDLTVLDDEAAEDSGWPEVMVYSSGRYLAERVILPYEGSSDSHEDLIEELRPLLMRMKIFLD